MPEALEFGSRDWDLKKRKKHDLISPDLIANSNNMSTDEWESSSTTPPKLKRAKSQSDWRSGGSEEVGDSDDLQLVGREIFDPTGIGLDNGVVGIGLDGHGEGAMEIQGNKPKKSHEVLKESEKDRNNVREVVEEGIKDDSDDKRRQEEPLTMSGNRLCMQSIMMELKKAREDMLLWLRQEMHNIIYEGASPGMRTGLAGGGQGGGEMEYEEQQASGQNGIGGGVGLGNGSAGIDFGAQDSGSGGAEFFAGQNNSPGGGGGGGGIDYNGQDDGDANFGTQNGVSGKEDMSLGKLNDCSDGAGMRFAGDKSGGQADVGFEVRDNGNGNGNGNGGISFGVQNRGHGGGVAMSLHNGSVQVLGFERQNGTGDGIISFRNQNEVPSDVTFGAAQPSGSGAMNCASQSGRETGMAFGGQNIENATGIQDGGRSGGIVNNRNSAGIGRLNASTSSAGNHKVNSAHISDEERTVDLIGMQSQNLQNPVTLNMMWNNVTQSPRGINQNISHSALHGFNYDMHTKLGSGTTGTYRGLVHNGAAYESNLGMMNQPVLQPTNPTMGMQLPMGMQNATSNNLNTSGMSSLMGMQNQVPMQNFSGMQNFLGLSTNGNMGPTPTEGIRRQVFPGLYLNERQQHASNAKLNPLSATAGMPSRSHRRAGTLLGVDMLELNS